MCNQPDKKSQTVHQQQDDDPNHLNPFLQCASLILPWLTHKELASTSLTCKPLSHLSSLLTLHRSLDATRSLEPHHHPIPFQNHTVSPHYPYAYFLYTPTQIPSSHYPKRQHWGCLNFQSRSDPEGNNRVAGSCGCGCEGCGGNGLESDLEEVGVMWECGPGCGCGLECGNRFSQRGIVLKLKIVWCERKGWGLFAGEVIRRGQFVCEYAGELLTTKEARSRQRIYDELSTTSQICPALLVVREHLPSGKACLRMNIDATRIGNVARFINHSCDGGNLSTILVRSSGALMPRLCFFASRDIKENEELTFSYGEIRAKANGLQCFCGSSCCHGVLPSEDT